MGQRQAAWRTQLVRTVDVQHGQYQTCACKRVRCWKPHNGKKVFELDNSNATCAVHKPLAHAGVKEAHDMVKRLVPGAEVLGEVPLKTLGCQGRAMHGGKFVSKDGAIDLLVRGTRGVDCAVEVNGPEHLKGDVPARDRKKREYLREMHVPMIELNLAPDRTVPAAEWEDKLSYQHSIGHLS